MISGEAVLLEERGTLRICGLDARKLLHDIVTSDIAGLKAGEARHAALLAPQGKILFDFIVFAAPDDSLWLDLPRETVTALTARLTFYRLRAKVVFEDMSATHSVAAGWGGVPEAADVMTFADPRLAELGQRALGARAAVEGWVAGAVPADEAAYHARRVRLGIPEAGRDFPLGEVFPHEADMDQLGGVDFAKGCFIGQEVVSRMQHRGTARRRFVPVTISGDAPQAGAEIRAGELLVGTMGGTAAPHGLALLRLDRVEEALEAGVPITSGSATLTVAKPDWARFAFPGEKPLIRSGGAA